MATKFVGGSYLSDPAVLGNVACWYKFWDPTTMEQSVGGGGGNPGNGDPIGYVLDQSGNGLHLTAAGGSQRPTFQTNVNGTAGAALFDGSNDELHRLTVSNVTANRSAFTIIAVVKHTATPTGREPYALFSTAGGTATRIEHNASGAVPNRVGGAVRRANADTLTSIAGSTALGTGIHYVTCRVNYAADTFEVFLDGQLEASGVPPGTSGANSQNTNGRIYVGSQGTAFFQGHYFELLCLHAAPTDDELRILWNYMRAQSQIG
jgi:hypothetical protein